ncbi:hypothetical protein GCM10027262_76190 [Nocardia tengchongensis]
MASRPRRSRASWNVIDRRCENDCTGSTLTDWKGWETGPGQGGKPRLTKAERNRTVASVATTPPGRLMQQSDGGLHAEKDAAASCWTLDSLTDVLRAEGIVVGRSQVRRILVAEGVRWRRPRSWTTSKDPYFVPKEPTSSVSTRSHPKVPR